jgi:hypothetical protein
VIAQHHLFFVHFLSPSMSRSADDAADHSLEPVPGEKFLFFVLALALFYYVYRVARRTFAGRQSVSRAVKAATEGD